MLLTRRIAECSRYQLSYSAYRRIFVRVEGGKTLPYSACRRNYNARPNGYQGYTDA